MSNELVECAFNQQAKRSNCVAYCENHKCYLTITQLKNMKCLQKQCRYLSKDTTHKFWIERAERRKMKKFKIIKEK